MTMTRNDKIIIKMAEKASLEFRLSLSLSLSLD